MTLITRFLRLSALSGYLIGLYIAGAGNNPTRREDSINDNSEASLLK